MNDDSLEVRQVTVRFGGLTALDGVSLTAPPNQVTGIIGPNGAGKTTLLNVLCGLVRPESGSARFAGRELLRLRPHQLAGLGIARTLQGVGLFGGLSVAENVMVGATCHARAGTWPALLGLLRSDRDERMLRARAMAALELVGVAEHADRMPGTLPYGVRKRVALARALASGPRLLLLDEPASGLSEQELGELGQVQADPAVTAAYLGIAADGGEAGAGAAGAGEGGAGEDGGRPGGPGGPGPAGGGARWARAPPSRSRASRPATGAPSCCTASRSPCRQARSRPCSAPTGPARRPCCARSAGWSGRGPGGSWPAGRM